MVSDWKPQFKRYPHFDKDISGANIEALVHNPSRVAENSFFPFLRYSKSYQPFRSKISGKPPRKNRPLRYASRRDAYIFSYYRHLLSAPYEALLKAEGLSDTVLAYRKIPEPTGGGKSNIQFARDAFQNVRLLGTCTVATLDIGSFFECIDHARLGNLWCRLLGVSSLPPDHAAVFKAVTQYAVVDREAAYERLGYLRREVIHGRERLAYTTSYDDMPRQLCSMKDFREKICGKGGEWPTLIESARENWGIPQGSPISDLLANLSLIEFDRSMREHCENVGGSYLRYSDDIMLIVPGEVSKCLALCDLARVEIALSGDKLRFKDSKTRVVGFRPGVDRQSCFNADSQVPTNGLEYLGFRFDGRSVYLRDSTVARLHRKIAGGVKAACAEMVARYPGRDAAYVISRFDFGRFLERFGRVEDFDPHGNFDGWTFWTYARRAMTVFGPVGRPIAVQLRKYKTAVRSRVGKEIVRRLAK